MKTNSALKRIVVVGGGTAGWVSAACLGYSLQYTDCEVVLIESPDIPTIGVGEATIPSFVDFIQFLGISKTDFVKRTQSTFKLAIRFYDWLEKGHDYWHQFGNVGRRIDAKPFYQHWLKSKLNGSSDNFTDYSPSIAMAKQDRFFIPPKNQPSVLSDSTYAWHFDAGLVAEYLSEYSKNIGVKHIAGSVTDVQKDDNGFIKAVAIKESGTLVEADFFIDCSGQRALLLNGALGVPYEDWQKYLPVDRAYAVQTENSGPLKPYTEAFAGDHGWRWRIPLQRRTGNGYIFCSDFCDEETALRVLLDGIEGKSLTEPRLLRFKTGKRKQIWCKNCLAIGLSAGFLEPLESTSIYLAMRGILNFVQALPNGKREPETAAEYNRLMDTEFQCIRDFIVLHYCASRREDTEFWRMWRNMDLPDSLKTKLSLFREQGRLMRNDLDLFSADSWYAVLEGMGVRPETYDWTVDGSDYPGVQKIMADSLAALDSSVARLPFHREFVDAICARSS